MDSIKIGPVKYDVADSTEQLDNGFDTPRWGDIRHDKLLIRLLAHAHRDVRKITLIHEALHGIGFVYSIDLSEEVVSQLAPALVSFFEDNGVDISPLID